MKKFIAIFFVFIFSLFSYAQDDSLIKKKKSFNDFLNENFGDELRKLGEKFYEIADKLEIKPYQEEPDWAKKDSEPIFTFVQLSDTHYTGNVVILQNALKFISTEVNPDFVIFTGDNVYPPTIEQHKKFKKLLDENLKCRYFVIKGDNDTRHFEDVFGDSIYSFDYCGVHFVALALDWDFEFIGIGFFRHYRWLIRDLWENRDKPFIVFMHTNIVPPTFLSAPTLCAILYSFCNFTATLTGHLHIDLEFEFLKKKHIIAPSVTLDKEHGFKLFSVYKDDIIVRTFEFDAKTNKYCFAMKYQRILFPGKYKPSESKKKNFENFDYAPANKTRYIDEYYYEQIEKMKRMLGRNKR